MFKKTLLCLAICVSLVTPIFAADINADTIDSTIKQTEQPDKPNVTVVEQDADVDYIENGLDYDHKVTTSSITEKNSGSIGAVDIKLTQELEGADSGQPITILPGSEINLKTKLTNKAEPAWVRVKIEYPTVKNDQGLELLNDDSIRLASDEWQLIGDYYYLNRAMKHKESIDITEKITLPNEWSGGYNGEDCTIAVKAEAIQEKYFKPDFTSDDPWYGAVIETFDSTNYKPEENKTQNKHFGIIYNGGAEGLLKTEDDFFSNWERLIPGAVMTGKAEICNNMMIPVEIYFNRYAETKNKTKNSGVLEQIHLVIKNNNKEIFNDTLDKAISEDIILKKYDAGENSILSYELSIPEDAGNVIAQQEFTDFWTFSVKEYLPKQKPIDTIKDKLEEIKDKIAHLFVQDYELPEEDEPNAQGSEDGHGELNITGEPNNQDPNVSDNDTPNISGNDISDNDSDNDPSNSNTASDNDSNNNSTDNPDDSFDQNFNNNTYGSNNNGSGQNLQNTNNNNSSNNNPNDNTNPNSNLNNNTDNGSNSDPNSNTDSEILDQDPNKTSQTQQSGDIDTQAQNPNRQDKQANAVRTNDAKIRVILTIFIVLFIIIVFSAITTIINIKKKK